LGRAIVRGPLLLEQRHAIHSEIMMIINSLLTFGRAVVLAAATLSSASVANAMSVSPMHIEMISVGKTSTSQIKVTNEGSTPLPIEAILEKMSLSESGDMNRVRTADNFVIIPPQALIPAGGTQVFRVQWVGEPDLQKSESYLLSLSQIPVKLPKNQNAVQIVTSMGVMINVSPARGKPSLEIVETGTVTGKDGKRRATIVIANNSPVHGLIEKSDIKLSAGSFTKNYSASELGQRLGIGLVQPGKRRKFVMPDALPANAKQVQASLTYQAGK
jgi:fimbrial chaperone protein